MLLANPQSVHAIEIERRSKEIRAQAPKFSAHMRNVIKELCGLKWHTSTVPSNTFCIPGIIPSCKTPVMDVVGCAVAAFDVHVPTCISIALECSRRRSTRELIKRHSDQPQFQSFVFSLGGNVGREPTHTDYAIVKDGVSEIVNLMGDERTAGLTSLALCAIFETTSVVTIGELEERLRATGKPHNTGDLVEIMSPRFCIDLCRAVDEEIAMDYPLPDTHVKVASNAALQLFRRIWV